VEGKGSFLNSGSLKEFSKEMVNRGYREFIFDLGKCVMMDSTFMGTMAGVALRLKELGQGHLRVVHCGQRSRDLLSGLGLDQIFTTAWQVVQWILPFTAMFLAFSAVYYFAPNIKGAWHWVTPGAALGVVIWLMASLGFRAYLHFFDSYSATYGSLGAVVILLLWLYITGFAILIGAELNWIIEAADRGEVAESATTQVQRRAA
jgi:YihY family inner membrane protein